MKQSVVLPQQSNYYGERCRFLHGYHKSGDLSCLKNLTYYLAKYMIRLMSRPQNWSKMIQNTVFMAHKDTANLSTKNPFRRQPQLILQMSEDEGWCPWGRLDDSHDDALTIAILTDSNVPSLLITYIKV